MRAPGGLALHNFTDITVPAGSYSHLGLTYSGANNINGANLYRNGVASIVTPGSFAINNSWLEGQDFTIGARNTVFEYSGLLDEILIWNKELSAAEMLTLFILGPSGDLSSLLFFGNLVNRWPCGDGDTIPTLTDNIGTDDILLIGGPTFVQDVP